jgi:beta-glucosidase
LSYTTFAVAGLDVLSSDGVVVARGTLRNTGDRDGADVIQVYAELPDPDAPARLVGFTRVEVAAGGEARFEVRVPVDRLATRDPAKHAWVPAAGRHRFVVARHAGDPEAVTADVDL